tara:strand:- start:223 stop:735 length:513 start_codon:yes stop_codon:yes gene_type:complete
MKLEIVEKKNYTEVWMWRSTFKTMYKAKDSIWLNKGDRIHIPTGSFRYKKYIAYNEEQLIRKSSIKTIYGSNKPINGLLSEMDNQKEYYALDTLFDMEHELGLYPCNASDYEWGRDECYGLRFSVKNLIGFTEISDGSICPICDERYIYGHGDYFPDREYLEERMVDKNL